MPSRTPGSRACGAAPSCSSPGRSTGSFACLWPARRWWPLYGLLGERLGAVGLAIASSIAITVYTVVMSLRLRQTLAGPNAPTLVGFVLKMLLITALGILGGEALDQGVGLWIGPEGLGGPTARALLRGALGGGAAMILCLGLAWVFGVNEAVEVVRRVQDALARRLGARLPFFRRKS